MDRQFSGAVLKWYHDFGRKNLPWQQNPTPYRVWVSEVMLQQTQVNTVIPYFQSFMQIFPDVHSLAAAPIESVLMQWTGLGYYARARNLHRAAQKVVSEYAGIFPDTLEGLCSLPGVGMSTAGAIQSLSMDKWGVILDGNVKRVLTRVKGIESWSGEAQTLAQLWEFAHQLTPTQDVKSYNQAMMDLGATLCTRAQPRCSDCPVMSHCEAFKQGKQRQIPVPKPSKKIEERPGHMYVVEREDGAILLKRRPLKGIWAGLWCFPLQEDPVLADCEWREYEEKGDVVHTFSHYRWRIQLTRCQPKETLPLVQDDYFWYTPDQRELPLAAVVRAFLANQERGTT